MRLLPILLLLTGCGNMQPVDVCAKTGILTLVNIELCGSIGDGKFDPQVKIEEQE